MFVALGRNGGGSGADELIDSSGGGVTLDGGSGKDACQAAGGDDTLISCETAP